MASGKLTITQYGGSEGSTAGDCCVIVAESDDSASSCVIDLGTSAEGQWTLLKNAVKGDTGVLFVTHLHGDHTGRTMPPVPFVRKGWKAVHSKAVEHVLNGEGAKNQTNRWFTNWDDCEVPANGDLVWSAPLGDDRVEMIAIVPDFDKVKKRLQPKGKHDQNECSMGALIQVLNGRRQTLFSFLTLGDMVPENSAAVTEVLKARNCESIDVLKFPHHGSDNNYLPCITDVLESSDEQGRRTAVIVSGFTSGQSTSWGLLGEEGADSVTFLVRNALAAASLLSLSTLGNLATKHGIEYRVWKGTRITVEHGKALMEGTKLALKPRGFMETTEEGTAKVTLRASLAPSVALAPSFPLPGSSSTENNLKRKFASSSNEGASTRRRMGEKEESDEESDQEQEEKPTPVRKAPTRRRRVIRHNKPTEVIQEPD